MNKKNVKMILTEYFIRDMFGQYTAIYAEESKMWTKMFKELFGEE